MYFPLVRHKPYKLKVCIVSNVLPQSCGNEDAKQNKNKRG